MLLDDDDAGDAGTAGDSGDAGVLGFGSRVVAIVADVDFWVFPDVVCF